MKAEKRWATKRACAAAVLALAGATLLPAGVAGVLQFPSDPWSEGASLSRRKPRRTACGLAGCGVLWLCVLAASGCQAARETAALPANVVTGVANIGQPKQPDPAVLQGKLQRYADDFAGRTAAALDEYAHTWDRRGSQRSVALEDHFGGFGLEYRHRPQPSCQPARLRGAGHPDACVSGGTGLHVVATGIGPVA